MRHCPIYLSNTKIKLSIFSTLHPPSKKTVKRSLPFQYIKNTYYTHNTNELFLSGNFTFNLCCLMREREF